MLGLGERLHLLWHGPRDLPANLKLEWRFIVVRWLGIIGLAPMLPLANLAGDRLAAAYGVLALGILYNLGLQRAVSRRSEWLALGYVSTLGDGLLDLSLLIVSGGFNSPFYLILFTFTLAAGMRYGYGPALGVSVLCVCADAIGYLVARQQVGTGFILRSLLLPITTLLAGYLRENAQQAEAALQERLRQSNLLNDVTGSLGASLELDAVLQATVAAAARLFGSPVAVLRSSTGTFSHGDDPELIEQLARAITEAEPDRSTTAVLQLVSHDTSLARIAMFNRVGLDADLIASFVERVTLAIENAWLYRNLATAHQDLLSVDEMKTNFLANVSHELRTPLTSIRSFSELLLDYEQDAPVQKEFLRIISAESERLTRLVNDVLDISRIEAGHMNWEMGSLDLAALLQRLALTFAPQMERLRLQFHTELSQHLPRVHGDPDRLSQVVENLLNNAMKFTPGGGTVLLRAQPLHDEVHISVRDTGVGIAAADQARIFEKFHQLGDTLTDKPRGAGLGLPICRDIIDHHGGRLWVQSLPGAGSTFSMALPIESAVRALGRAA